LKYENMLLNIYAYNQILILKEYMKT